MADQLTQAPTLRTVPYDRVRFPWTVLGYSLVVSLVGSTTVMMVSAPMLGAGALVVALLTLVGASASLAWYCAIAPFLAATTRTLVVDEGGVRCRLGDSFVYWPFALLGSATHESPGFIFPLHGSITLRTAQDAVIFWFPLLRENLEGVLGSIAAEAAVYAIEDRRARVVRLAPPAAAAVARLGQPLPAWLRALDKLVSADDSAYRASVVDFPALLDVAADTAQDADLRAGAVYVLLAGGPADARAATRALLTEASPPIVLEMASLSPGGLALGIERELQSVAGYLEHDPIAAQEKAR